MSKKIILINSLTSGGAEKVVMTILESLNEKNSIIDLVCLEKNNFYFPLNKNIKIHYLSNSNGNENFILKFVNMFILAFKLKIFISKYDIKIVQSHLYRGNFVNALAKIFGTKHKVQMVNHGIISLYKQKGFLGKINLSLIKYLYPKADVLIFISKIMLLDYEKLFIAKNKKLVIHNPYNIKDIVKKSLDNVKFKFDQNKKYLLSVGRLIPLKRNQDLILALSKLPSNIDIIYLGDGPEKENLVELAKKLNIENRVHFLGNVENPYVFMHKCTILVSCSKNESFGNVLIESMACKLAIISSDCGGPREILSPSSNINYRLKDEIEVAEYGVLYPIGDVPKLIEAINLLLNDLELRNKFVDKLLLRANDFDVNKIIKEYKKVLEIE